MAEAKLTSSTYDNSSSGAEAPSSTRDIMTSSRKQFQRQHMENFIIFVIAPDGISLESISHLREIVNSVQTFDNVDECIKTLADVGEEKVFLIVSEELGEEITPLLHRLPQIKYIYVFCPKNQECQKWAKQYHKVHGTYETISCVCEQMKQDKSRYSNSLISMSVLAPTITKEEDNNKQEAAFMYSQLLNEILLEIETTELEVTDFKDIYGLLCKQE